MVELSEQDLKRFENEFNRIRADVEVFRAVQGAILANVLAARPDTDEFFEDMRAQCHTGLTRAAERHKAPEAMREFQRTALNEFFDGLAEQLEIARTSEGRSGTH